MFFFTGQPVDGIIIFTLGGRPETQDVLRGAHSFIRSFVRPSIHSFLHSFLHSFIHAHARVDVLLEVEPVLRILCEQVADLLVVDLEVRRAHEVPRA